MSDLITASMPENDDDDPVTFHRIMQSMIGDGLKAHYEPQRKLSHELFVLMLQLKEQERSEKAAKPKAKKAQGPRPRKPAKPNKAAEVSL